MQDALLTPETLITAYCKGYFPMADSRDGQELRWYSPMHRGVIPLDDGFHIPRSLQKFMKRCPYTVTADKDFSAVIRACADVRTDTREDTWINDHIIALYEALAQQGHAHSIEVWHEGELVGGLYGVSLGGAFFGESMFSTMSHASKVALVHLVQRLRQAGYFLLDTQYVNDHLRQFGVLEVPRADYLESLEKALYVSPNPSTRFLTESDIKS